MPDRTVWLKVAGVFGIFAVAAVCNSGPDRTITKEVNPYPDAILCRKDYPVRGRAF